MDFRQNNKFLTKFIIYLTFFLLGIGFYHIINKKYIENKSKNNNYEINVDNNFENKELNFDKYNSVYNYLKEYYYDFDQVKNDQLEESSIVGLVEGLKDPYTEYFNPEQNKDFQDSLSGDFQGIGAVLEKDKLGVKIISVLKNSPAEKSEIKPGDIITEVNGKKIAKLSTTEVISLIKGPAGKEINLVILRNGDEILEKKLFTDHVIIPSIVGEDFGEDIGYIGMSTFGENTGKEFKKTLDGFKNKKGIIIDLRNNGGGYLDTAKEILSNFIKNGEVIAITKYKNQPDEKYFSSNTGGVYEGKVVILVNEFSASASEILAGAMKDYQKAILVGQKTYGKGSVQSQLILPDGSMVKITIAKWFTPKNISIDKEGITPDIEVKIQDEDLENKYDRQLEEAKKVLKSFINNNYLNLSIDKYKNSESISVSDDEE